VICKVAYLGEGMFQVGNNDIPLDETSLLQLVQSYADLDDGKALTWLDEIKQTKSGQLQEKEANRGVIVDLYEVEYPTPTNPLKETEDLASHLDEKKDFVTQYLFPGNETKDITVGLAKDLLKGQPQPSSIKQATKQGWRRVLSFVEQRGSGFFDPSGNWYSVPFGSHDNWAAMKLEELAGKSLPREKKWIENLLRLGWIRISKAIHQSDYDINIQIGRFTQNTKDILIEYVSNLQPKRTLYIEKGVVDMWKRDTILFEGTKEDFLGKFAL
jgi:hypothetical protein